MSTIKIPTPLRTYTDGKSEVEVEGESVASVFDSLLAQYPDLRQHLFKDDGSLRDFVNVFLGDEDIRFLDGLATPVNAHDRLRIVPSVAGGTAPAIALDPAQVTLSNEEVARYSRHLILPDVGIEGQRKLKAARILVVGTGGLGSPVSMYLAAAGIGTIGLVDYDVVDASNLQRQVIHGTSDIGRAKLDSAATTLADLNPFVKLIKHPVPLTSENALDIVKDYDIVIDGTDNFPTRYLVNDACIMLGKLNVYGSIFRFEGQVSVFGDAEGPCYRCLFPEPPPPGMVPSCAEGGVLGILPGTIGTLQATEAIKLVLGIGEPLVGRLMLYDALAMTFDTMKIRRNPECPVCGPNPTLTELIDYEAFCGMPAHDHSLYGQAQMETTIPEISVFGLKRRLDAAEDLFVLDVREAYELQISHLEAATHIPKGEVAHRLDEIPQDRPIVVMCRVGGRSAEVVELLQAQGYQQVTNLVGGINAWAREIDPTLPEY